MIEAKLSSKDRVEAMTISHASKLIEALSLMKMFDNDMPSDWGRSLDKRTPRQVALELPGINVTTPIDGRNYTHSRNVPEPRSP